MKGIHFDDSKGIYNVAVYLDLGDYEAKTWLYVEGDLDEIKEEVRKAGVRKLKSLGFNLDDNAHVELEKF